MTSSVAASPYRILIVTAVVPEAKVLVKALRLRKLPGELLAWAKEDVALVVVGVRAKRLNELLKYPLMASARGVVLAGVAGGLASELHLGAVVIDGKGVPGSVRELGVRMGLIHTSATIAATPQEKGRLLAETGCLAVDMETAIVRAFAGRRGAAFLSVRAISDTANEKLDPALLGLVDEAGRPLVGKAMGMILREPKKLGEMLRMRRAMGVAMRSLKEVVGAIIASNWPGKATGRPGGG
jgi:adenosylhomocysteine nucleosidase